MYTDVLILGAGAAGIRAALAAAEEGVGVTVVSKEPVTQSGSSFSSLSGGWGIQALIGDERTDQRLEDFYNDILQAGLGMADLKLALILVEESGPRMEDLLTHGLRFRKDPKGEYVRVKGCFSDCERAFLTEDLENIRTCFLNMLHRSGAKTLTGRAVDLITEGGVCRGAWIVSPDGKVAAVTSGATVLATGGGAGIFQDHLVTDEHVGGGYALAHRAGAAMRNLEFIQFMLGVKGSGIRRFFPLSELVKPGIVLDPDGEDLLSACVPNKVERLRACEERVKHYPFSTRDTSFLIDAAVARAREEGKRLVWDSGDPSAKEMELVHFSHAFNGGIQIDETGESTIPGLFAAGEVAAGPHGADRIGGCMMTATQVFGARAGKYAARRAQESVESSTRRSCPELPTGPCQPRNLNHKKGALKDMEREVKRISSNYLMMIRGEDGLKACLSEAREALSVVESTNDGRLHDIMSVRNALTVACIVAEAALRRKESLGPHYRTNYPSALPARDPKGPPNQLASSPVAGKPV